MREYYLFFIKKEIYPIYHKKSASFYRIFSKLRSCDKNNYAYGTSIFFQLCDLVPKTRLQTYFQKKQIKVAWTSNALCFMITQKMSTRNFR